MLRGNMAPRRPAKLHLSDQDRCGVGGAGLEVSPTALLDPSEDFLFPKAIATNSSREVAEEVGYPFKREWSVVGTEPTLLVRVNHEPLSTSELGPAGRAAFNRCEAEVPPPVSMFRKAIRSGSGEDDRRKLGVVGCSNDGFFADNCPPAAPNDSALSNATTPRAARLNDCEFRDRAPRALLLTFSRDIIAPTEDSRRASSSGSSPTGCNSLLPSSFPDSSTTISTGSIDDTCPSFESSTTPSWPVKLARHKGHVECESNHISMHS